MAVSIDTLVADFSKFQGDFGSFADNVQNALDALKNSGLNETQQKAVDTIDAALTGMDARIAGFTFPPASAPPAPEPPPAVPPVS